jgi:hypothetical protein
VVPLSDHELVTAILDDRVHPSETPRQTPAARLIAPDRSLELIQNNNPRKYASHVNCLSNLVVGKSRSYRAPPQKERAQRAVGKVVDRETQPGGKWRNLQLCRRLHAANLSIIDLDVGLVFKYQPICRLALASSSRLFECERGNSQIQLVECVRESASDLSLRALWTGTRPGARTTSTRIGGN